LDSGAFSESLLSGSATGIAQILPEPVPDIVKSNNSEKEEGVIENQFSLIFQTPFLL